MLSDSNKNLTNLEIEEQVKEINQFISTEVETLIRDFKSRGLQPVHIVLITSTLLMALLPQSYATPFLMDINATAADAIMELNSKKAKKVTIQ